MATPTIAARRAIRTPQQSRSRRTREAVLSSAVECFEAHGWDGTTTAMIADGNCWKGPPQLHLCGSSSEEKLGTSKTPSERWSM